MSVKQATLTRAIAMLKAIDAAFEIRLDDEITVHGEVHPKPQRQRGSRLFNYAPMKIKERLLTMQVGEVKEFTPELEGLDLPRLQSRICSEAGKVFGKGAVITHVLTDKVEVLRVL